jgi:hypothetical protein
MDDTTLLSEIHPLATKLFNPIGQAHKWHNIFVPKGMNFRETIKFIALHCENLVIRDWSHLDFVAVPFLEKPSYRMKLVEALSDFELLRIALVRDPIDTWLSLKKLALMRKLKLEPFLKGYLKFAEQAVKTGFVRYEDFVNEPTRWTKQICRKLKLKFDPDFLDKWYDYENITGDTGKHSRGSRMGGEIKSLPRPLMPLELLHKFRTNQDYQKSMEILKY